MRFWHMGFMSMWLFPWLLWLAGLCESEFTWCAPGYCWFWSGQQLFVSTFDMSWLLDCNCDKTKSVSHAHQSVQPVHFTSCPCRHKQWHDSIWFVPLMQVVKLPNTWAMTTAPCSMTSQALVPAHTLEHLCFSFPCAMRTICPRLWYNHKSFTDCFIVRLSLLVWALSRYALNLIRDFAINWVET